MNYSKRNAFTVIELLIVIGVLAILATLIGFAMTGLMGRQRATATRVTLANLRSLVSEHQTASKGLTRQPAYQWVDNAIYPPTPGTGRPLNIWIDGNPGDGNDANDPATRPEPDPAFAPANVTVNVATSGLGNTRYNADAVANTQLIMGLLAQTPNNRKAIEQLPSSQFMEEIPAGQSNVKLTVQLASGGTGTYSGAAARLNPPIILDAWGNPIIFVPAGGLAGSSASGAGAMWVGADEVTDPEARVIVSLPSGSQLGPIKSKDNRPFWASAGPDGDFCKADDNLYSFEE